MATSLRLRLSLVAAVLVLASSCDGAPVAIDAGLDADGTGGVDANRDVGATIPRDAGPPGPDASVPPTCVPLSPPTTGFHVSVTGSPSGDGSAARPWDLTTALAPHPSIAPGDTVWLHGGTYAGVFVSRVEGTPEAPVVVRSYPGEWAILDGAGQSDSTLQMYRGDVVFRDFEITNTDPDRTTARVSAIWSEGARIHLVHLVIHDTGNVPMYEEAPDMEVYGCLLYNIGFVDGDGPHGHNLYVQNETGEKRIEENVIFNGFRFGIHAYAEAGSHLRGLRFVGNVLWGNGSAAPGSLDDNTLRDNLLVGGTEEAADGIVVAENVAWSFGPGERNVHFGYSADNGSIVVRDNLFRGLVWFDTPWSSLELSGNVISGELMGVDASAYPGNTYLTTPPAEPDVRVRPSRWESGRGHVIVVNWPLASAVDVDLSAILSRGAEYEVRDAADFFSGPVFTGTWDGTPVSFALDARPAAPPIGASLDPSEETGGALRVFVVRTLDCSL